MVHILYPNWLDEREARDGRFIIFTLNQLKILIIINTSRFLSIKWRICSFRIHPINLEKTWSELMILSCQNFGIWSLIFLSWGSVQVLYKRVRGGWVVWRKCLFCLCGLGGPEAKCLYCLCKNSYSSEKGLLSLWNITLLFGQRPSMRK